MGWRSSYTRILERDEPDGITYAALKRVEAAMLSMPHLDRIALARELLAGTGRVVARDVEGVAIVPYISGANSAYSYNAGYTDGWNACRAAMLADDAGDGYIVGAAAAWMDTQDRVLSRACWSAANPLPAKKVRNPGNGDRQPQARYQARPAAPTPDTAPAPTRNAAHPGNAASPRPK